MLKVYCDAKVVFSIGALLLVVDENKQVLGAKILPGVIFHYEAVYASILYACELASHGSIIFTDYSTPVKHISGEFRANTPWVRNYLDKILELIKAKDLKVIWIPKDQNIAGLFLD